MGCLREGKKSKVEKGHNSEKKKKKCILNVSLESMDCSLDSEHILKFQVNIFRSNRDITKYQTRAANCRKIRQAVTTHKIS